MHFGFPSSNYAQSQVSSSNNQFETNYGSVENGGLFSREECRNLAKYIPSNQEKSSKPMTATETASVKQSKSPNG